MLKAIDESIDLAKRFENVLALIKQPVAFNPNWRSNNGNSYDGAVSVKLSIGQIVKSHDPENGRRLILIGTHLDTVVVYERHPPSKGQSFSLVYNANAALDFLLGGSFLSIARFSLVVTDYDVEQNIGTSLQNLYTRMERRNNPKPAVEEVVLPPK